MRSYFATFFCAAAAVAAVPALAAERRVVPANRATQIIFHYTVSETDCNSGGRPTFHVTGGPAHGAVTSIWRGFRMGKESGICAGKPVHGTVVIYKPNPGYHGPDKVSFVFSEGMGNDYFVSPKEYTVNITVK